MAGSPSTEKHISPVAATVF